MFVYAIGALVVLWLKGCNPLIFNTSQRAFDKVFHLTIKGLSFLSHSRIRRLPEINVPDGAGFSFPCKARPPAHGEPCKGGRNAAGERKDKSAGAFIDRNRLTGANRSPPLRIRFARSPACRRARRMRPRPYAGFAGWPAGSAGRFAGPRSGCRPCCWRMRWNCRRRPS